MNKRQILVYGGQMVKEYISYAASLTGKARPKVCFLPTAMGDHPDYIEYFNLLCEGLPVEPFSQKVWISTYSQTESFEEILTGMDVIIVGGGNTLNMMAIWKAQGIDKALYKAYQGGTVLAGGSAGSLCWFNGGTTDSRPGELTNIEGLNFLKYSHCPHFHSEAGRRPLYHENILSGKLTAGYACDDFSGILFVDGKVAKAVSLDHENHSYYVEVRDGAIYEEKLDSEILSRSRPAKPSSIEARLRRIKLLILDVDGTLTDGGIYMTDTGGQSKKYNAKDGYGIMRAQKMGRVEVGIISHSRSAPMVEERAKMIGIEYVYVGKEPKAQILEQWCNENGWTSEEVAFIGDDLNDLDIMNVVGVTACPADAVKAIQQHADIVLSKNGGDACVREFIDEYLLSESE